MKTLSSIATAMLASLALASCSEPHSPAQQSTGALGYESPAPVARTPLAPLGGYAAPAPSPGQGVASGPTAAPGWQASPRWAAIKGKGCIEVEPGEGGEAGMKIERCRDDAAPAGPAPQEQVEMGAQDEAFGLPPE